MKVIDIIRSKPYSLSFEIFPPKSSDRFESVWQAAEKIAALDPSFMSVTYGAAGGTKEFTKDIAVSLQERLHVTALEHLTCVNATRAGMHEYLCGLRDAGIENIMALRGDMPEGMESPAEYRHADELISEIRAFGGFCIGGAAYPEGHPQAPDAQTDIRYLKQKVDCGLDFLTTQMFFDNNILYNFMYRIREAGISVPVVAGIMPVTSAKQIKRICAISGTALPQRFVRIVDTFGSDPAAMTQAGIAYATEQIIDLYANGIRAVHVYSMNNPQVARKIKENLAEILK